MPHSKSVLHTLSHNNNQKCQFELKLITKGKLVSYVCDTPLTSVFQQ